ncbi:MAG: DUF3017 domain-containing protein [Nocardioides sp.]|uniref:DUF3017 domain-containing protein n=1 Tax=Nocardioides sp. TaxID=35761 RepID=UPI0039E276C3
MPAPAEQPDAESGDSGAAGPAESDLTGPGEAEPGEAGPGEAEGAGSGVTEPAVPAPRRYPSTIGGACYLGVLAITVIGLVIVCTGRWRTGVHWMAAALLLAGVLRAVLPGREAGMLAVRSRWFDVALLLLSGVALWLLGTTVPDA